MQTKTTAPTALLIIGLVAAPATAADLTGTSYTGVQFTRLSYEENGLPDDIEPTAIVGRFGHYFTPNFSLEGRLGFGLSDDSNTYTNGIITAELGLELDSLLGLYGVGHLPLSEAFSVYGFAGITKIEATVNATLSDGFNTASASASDDESGLSFGLGAEVGIAPNASLTFEYATYLDKSDFQLTALSAGVNLGF